MTPLMQFFDSSLNKMGKLRLHEKANIHRNAWVVVVSTFKIQIENNFMITMHLIWKFLACKQNVVECVVFSLIETFLSYTFIKMSPRI